MQAHAKARSLTPHAQTVGDAINVVEPARDQVDLQDCTIVEANRAQPIEILGRHSRGMPRQLGRVVEHGPICII
jgi:hypothetical protein